MIASASATRSLDTITRITPIRGGLSLRRSDERLRAELPALACPRDRRDLPQERTARRIGHRSRQGGRCSVAFVAVNADQAEDWNGPSGRHFIEQRERWERMRGRLTARLLAGAHIQDGENVLDIGCGCGDTTILAARATRSGHALGAGPSAREVLTGLSPAQAAELTRQVRDRLVAYASPGGVTMPSAAWLVTAHAV